MNVAATQSTRRILGRYALFDEIAAGGMATVHVGRLLGPIGFARTVAIKCLHPHYAKDPEFVSMFVDEARLAARIAHPNVVSTLDIVSEGGELFLVMEYVAGESLAHLFRAVPEGRVPPTMATAITMGALHGLHAAHEATSERGQPLVIVHRDVSPQNILVGTDGIARVLDFGIAKAASRLQTTREGQLKGKLGYMAPEQLDGEVVDRRADVYAAGVVLWEALTGKRLFYGRDGTPIVNSAARAEAAAPSAVAPGVPAVLDSIVRRALSPRPNDRYATAKEMAIALEETGIAASQREIGEWVELTARPSLTARSTVLADLDESSGVGIRGRDARAGAEEKTVSHAPMHLTDAETSGVVSRPGGVGAGAFVTRRRAVVVVAGVAALLAVGLLFVEPREPPSPPIIVHSAGAPPIDPPAPAPVTVEPSAASPRVAAHLDDVPAVDVTSLREARLPRDVRPADRRVRAQAAGGGRGASGVSVGGVRAGAGQRATSCNPPYTVDDDGVRVPKRECL